MVVDCQTYTGTCAKSFGVVKSCVDAAFPGVLDARFLQHDILYIIY